MDTDRLDALSRLFATSNTRRSVLSALLGAGSLGTTLGSAGAKGKSHRHRKSKGKNASRTRAQTQKKPLEHCISPFGLDLNEFYDVSEQIILASFCDHLNSGQQWRAASRWAMNPTFEVVPEGFIPAGDTPLEDFIAKFSGVKYVIDKGTAQEKTLVFPNSDKLFTGELGGSIIASPITLGTLKPLSVGDHTLDIFWEMNALHCDGLGDVLFENCLPAGELTYAADAPITVTAGHQ